ncbi:hypothetical protein DS843_22765 [Roseomonas genomospecies 6]|uniref:Uncharacterized protein n=2 Tax=Roseomonas genomospecies 6 TaxID=214106 RepID=A0A9W7KS77_9PROT|nr:hypothetical protein DS843_22765 [Roseomonas genomospecies 6]
MALRDLRNAIGRYEKTMAAPGTKPKVTQEMRNRLTVALAGAHLHLAAKAFRRGGHAALADHATRCRATLTDPNFHALRGVKTQLQRATLLYDVATTTVPNHRALMVKAPNLEGMWIKANMVRTEAIEKSKIYGDDFQSRFAERVRAGQDTSEDDWRQYLSAYHDLRAKMAETYMSGLKARTLLEKKFEGPVYVEQTEWVSGNAGFTSYDDRRNENAVRQETRSVELTGLAKSRQKRDDIERLGQRVGRAISRIEIDLHDARDRFVALISRQVDEELARAP